MQHRLVFTSLRVLLLSLALAPAALASTTWYVDGVNGNDENNCLSSTTACKTIGHAISLASSGDSIMVAPATYTENLTINFSLKVIGSGAKTTIVDGGGVNKVVTIFERNADVTLANLTIQNGNGNGTTGGGILNAGRLTFNNSTISGNSAVDGGGISNEGTLTINNSTISGNAAQTSGALAVYGGGVFNEYGGVLTINNSTVSGNNASGGKGGFGGGISNAGTITISNVTFSGNGASVQGGNIDNSTLDNEGKATLQNSVLANATSGGNCDSTMTSEGYNLSDDNSCNFNGPGDLNDTKAKLGTLGNNGGPTQTIPELGGPTVEHGNPGGCTDSEGHLLTTDQRGYPRPGAEKHHKRCDMGAYERQTD